MELIQIGNPSRCSFAALLKCSTFIYNGNLYIKKKEETPKNAICISSQSEVDFLPNELVTEVTITEIKYYI